MNDREKILGLKIKLDKEIFDKFRATLRKKGYRTDVEFFRGIIREVVNDDRNDG